MMKIGKLSSGRKVSLGIWGLIGLGLIVAVIWLAVERLDLDDPWINLKTPVEVVGAKTTLTLEAGDQTSGLREVRVTLRQGDKEKVVLARNFPPGASRAPGWRCRLPWSPRPWVLRRARRP